jgi:hypothetical protein
VTTFLTMLGLAALGYVGATVLAWASLFRKAWRGDRMFLSMIWPYSLPMAAVLWIRLRRRPALPKARARPRSFKG